MPWDNSPAGRRQSAETYGPEYRAARRVAAARADGRCERCGKRTRLTCDHITPRSQGGSHHPNNLQMLCAKCHGRKTAQEGGGYRAKAAASDPQPTPRTAW